MQKFLFTLLAATVFIVSCNTKPDENKQLQDEVIAVHDEIMPLMSDFVKNSIKIDSLLASDKINSEENKEELVDLKATLDDANEAMNDWMYEFEMEHEDKSDGEIKKYLENELTRINLVKEKFSEASKKSTVLENY